MKIFSNYLKHYFIICFLEVGYAKKVTYSYLSFLEISHTESLNVLIVELLWPLPRLRLCSYYSGRLPHAMCQSRPHLTVTTSLTSNTTAQVCLVYTLHKWSQTTWTLFFFFYLTLFANFISVRFIYDMYLPIVNLFHCCTEFQNRYHDLPILLLLYIWVILSLGLL